MWLVAMSISTQRPKSPFGLAYSALDAALGEQTCELIKALQDIGLVRSDCDSKAIGEIVFNNLYMMFIGFVKDDAMPMATLRKNIRAQNAALVFILRGRRLQHGGGSRILIKNLRI